jgi:choline dehydrogenase-like flavoprotein
MLSDLGMEEGTHHRNVYLHEGMAISATAHQAGTAKFGNDPASSVLDLDCKAHELDNLYVIDSSFFASIGAVNPTLTIIANALRVGDHLLERMR